MFSEANLKVFSQNPVEFYTILRKMAMTQHPYLRENFIKKIESLSSENEMVAVALQALIENGELSEDNISKNPDIAVVREELPLLAGVWDGPQEDWLTKDGVLRVGIFWAQEDRIEQQEFRRFGDIFSKNGQGTSYEGYKEVKVKKIAGVRTPDRIFAKKFAATGRTIEMHLFADLNAMNANWYPIVVSRGHPRNEGLFDATDYQNTIRFALHSYSQRQCETLIRNNTDAAVVAIIGGEKGRDSDKIFLSFLEYLGKVDHWDDWQELKKRAYFDMPENLPPRYRFPNDTSFRFAAYIQKINQLKRRVVN